VWLSEAWASWSYVLQYYLVVAMAALTGAVAGAGDASSRFLEYELNHPRRRPVTPSIP
jgi:hypothetical protein